MKTYDSNLEPVVYQHRFDHSNKNFGSALNTRAPHQMLNKTIKNRSIDNSKVRKILFYKVVILLACTTLFAALSFIF